MTSSVTQVETKVISAWAYIVSHGLVGAVCAAAGFFLGLLVSHL